MGDDTQQTLTETVEKTLDEPAVRAVLEAVFFAADEPLDRKTLSDLIPRAREETVNRVVHQMELDYSGSGHGFHLVEIAGGYQFRTNPDYNEYVLSMFEARPTRLSKAALETLAIVAYRQPVTRAVVEDIRGVDCGGMLRKLQDLELVKVVGRVDDIGRPHLHGTTQRFLEYFGLSDLTDLPTLDQFEVDALEFLGEDLAEFLPQYEEGAEEDVHETEDAEAGVEQSQPAERMSGKHLETAKYHTIEDDDEVGADQEE